MREFNIHVPTYFGSISAINSAERSKEEFDEPYVPVVIRRADGVRIVLGSVDFWDMKAPDIQIERRPRGWAIFLHPSGGGDASGFVYFVDDGRSFVVAESDLGSTPPVRLTTMEVVTREIDNQRESGEKEAPLEEPDDDVCELCGRKLPASGENWDGLCPTCADKVSDYLDENNLDDADRDTVIIVLSAVANTGMSVTMWRELSEDS